MRPRSEDPDDTDRQFCWQQVLRVLPLFRLSYPYAPKRISVSLLALYALLAALEEALCRVSDESVSRAKLGWWQQQLLGPDCSTSTHPIMRQLRASGFFTTHAREHLLGLLATTMGRLDAPAPVNEQELESLCRLIGLYPMRLELAMQGGGSAESPALAAACAVNGLVQLLRESSRSDTSAYAWVPLNILAHHGLTRHELQIETQPDRVRPLMLQLCALGLSWPSGEKGAELNTEPGVGIDAQWRRRHRHWIIQAELNARLLKHLRSLRTRQHRRAFAATGPGYAWLAWRSARKNSIRDSAA